MKKCVIKAMGIMVTILMFMGAESMADEEILLNPRALHD